MKNNLVKSKVILILCMTAITSCLGDTAKVSVPSDFDPEKIASNQNQLQQILTREMVADVVDVEPESLMISVEQNLSKNEQYSVLYSWPSGKNKRVGDGKYEIEEYYSIGIGFVKRMNLSDFEKYYGSNAGLQMLVNEMPRQKHFNKETAIAEAKYIAEYARVRKFKKLENIGTSAFWETPINALHVLAKDAAFTLTANLGEDEDLARKRCIELVKVIVTQ